MILLRTTMEMILYGWFSFIMKVDTDMKASREMVLNRVKADIFMMKESFMKDNGRMIK